MALPLALTLPRQPPGYLLALSALGKNHLVKEVAFIGALWRLRDYIAVGQRVMMLDVVQGRSCNCLIRSTDT